MRRLLLTAALALAAAAAPQAAQAADCPPAPSGDHATFDSVGNHQLRVPLGVDRVTVDARGGHGGAEDDTAPGGQGGVANATVAVTPGECLDVIVGDYGYVDGGFGLGSGGARGTQSLDGYNGGGGGGASALVRGGTLLVAAGGGGGGGGRGEFEHYQGGRGGDGAGGAGAGTPHGGTGSNAAPAPLHDQFLGGDGGAARDGDHDGTDGVSPPLLTPNTGAGGGGGGGATGGAGGAAFVPLSWPDDGAVVGGGGGGGGSSYAAPGAQDVSFTVAGASCPPNGGPAACHGEVSLSWIEVPAHVRPYGDGDQEAVITTRFPRPLQARVTAASGDPLGGVTVTFALPASGAGGWFIEADGPTNATATTGADGVASSPGLVANATGGAWTATASVATAGVRPASFALRNEPATTATALFASANPSQSGEPVRFSAVVDASPTSAGVPTGVVEFRVGNATIGHPVALNAAGTATSDPVSLEIGDHEVTAVYSGGRDFRASSAKLSQTVQRASSVVALSSSRNPSPDGEPVTFEAEVLPAGSATGTPSGSVRFTLDGNDLGAVALSAGRASISPPASDLGVGAHVLVARYEGDASFAGSAASLEQTVGTGVTATEIASSRRPSEFGEPLTFTATVRADAAGTPAGAIDFRVDGEPACTGVTLDGSAQAACTVPAPLPAGEHTVTAAYSGDATFSASRGTALQRIDRTRTTVGVLATPSPSVFGERMTLHADVSPLAPGAGTPGGAVQFRVDGADAGAPVALTEDGATSPPLPPLDAGPHTIEARYAGDRDFQAAQRAAVTVIDVADVAATASASANPAAVGSPVTLRMALAAQSPGAGVPSGTVQFSVDGAEQGGPVPVRRGVAVSPPVDGLAPGVHEVRGSYAGDGDFAPAEATFRLSVVAPAPGGRTAAPTSTAVTSSPNPSAAGDPVVVTATVAPAPAGGTVAFEADGVPLAGCDALAPRDGVAVCRISGLAPGTHVLTAAFSGSRTAGASSGHTTQVVEGPASSLGPPRGAPQEEPCQRPVVLTSVRVRRGRLVVAGLARPAYAGRRVTITQRGRRIARATVHRDGRFRARAPRPRGHRRHVGRVRAHVAGHRSAAVRPRQRLRVTHRRALAGGRVRLRARLAGRGRRRVAVQRLAACPGTPAHRIATVRSGRRGRIVATLPGPGWYQLRTIGTSTRSLPIVVSGGDPSPGGHA